MAKIEIGRYSEQLRRWFGMAGIEIVAGEMAPEISPVVVLEQPAQDSDFLKGVRHCYGQSAITGVALNTSKVALINRIGSGTILTIQELVMSGNAISGHQVRISSLQVDHAAIVNTFVPDTRWRQTVAVINTVGRLSFTNGTPDVMGGDGLIQQRPLPNTPTAAAAGLVILPGRTLEFGVNTLQVTLTFFVHWTERHLPALEQ